MKVKFKIDKDDECRPEEELQIDKDNGSESEGKSEVGKDDESRPERESIKPRTMKVDHRGESEVYKDTGWMSPTQRKLTSTRSSPRNRRLEKTCQGKMALKPSISIQFFSQTRKIIVLLTSLNSYSTHK